MIWKDAMLVSYQTQKDRLGNDISTGVIDEHLDITVRHTPWTAEEILADKREITKTEQRYVTNKAYDEIKKFQHMLMGDVLYEITETQDLEPRWSVIRVRVYKK